MKMTKITFDYVPKNIILFADYVLVIFCQGEK